MPLRAADRNDPLVVDAGVTGAVVVVVVVGAALGVVGVDVALDT